jgi:ankyrin repeat protein
MMTGKPLDGLAEFLKHPSLDFNPADENGETPIHIAARSIHTDIILKLLEYPQVDPNICDAAGQNALHKAARASAPEALKNMLTRKGLDVNKQDSAGLSPLHIAAKAKESAGVQALLAQPGIQVTLRDNNGQTPLHAAAAAGTFNIIKAILAAGGSMARVKDRSGVSLCFARRQLSCCQRRTGSGLRNCSRTLASKHLRYSLSVFPVYLLALSLKPSFSFVSLVQTWGRDCRIEFSMSNDQHRTLRRNEEIAERRKVPKPSKLS